ncbi:MAG: ABC transporter permease, partial [Chloroflexales bacterium]|nr:ABC transporter permease [Chloroflexales bacterium]
MAQSSRIGSYALEQMAAGFRNKLARTARLLQRDWSGIVGLIMVALVVATALGAPWIAPHDPLEQNLRVSKMPPVWHEGGSWEYPLGADTLGRDILSRIIYGSRVSVTVGFFGGLLACSLGLIIGLIAGYAGGRVDNVLMGSVSLILALPYLVFVVFIAAILGRSLVNVILIFGLTDIPIFARITRSEVLRLRES